MNSPLEAGATTLNFGLRLAIQMNCEKLCIVTDSQSLASLCTNELESDNNVLTLCKNLLQELGNPLVCHEGRTFNKAADILAKAGRRKETI